MEIYKDIDGYEGIYAVSNMGNVLSYERIVNGRINQKYIKRQKNLSQKTDRFGYKTVSLWDGKRLKTISVHRLVAIVFLGKKNGLQVNHKNGVRDDNRLENLEWVTQSENIKHSYSVLGRSPNWNKVGNAGIGAIRNKKIRMIMPDGKYSDFYSATNAVCETGISMPVINRIVNGRQSKTRNGVIFKYI